jgi:chitinase
MKLLIHHREDIKLCQESYGKTIIMSLGGATYSEGGFPDAGAAESAADRVWGLFGSDTSYENRPFGSAVVDGFDFDYESTTRNFVPFAKRLRSHMDGATSKKFYLSAAPQCFFPDAAMGEMLDGVIAFDFIMVQFYNNWCGLNNFTPGSETQNAFNFDVWDNWAKTSSANPNVKILLGAPANTRAAGSGYLPADRLVEVINYSKRFSSFGGLMFWDMSQAYTNPGFLQTVYAAL